MVRFSCFHAHIHSNKSKKTVQPSVKATHYTFQERFQIQALKDSTSHTSLNPLSLKAQEDTQPIKHISTMEGMSPSEPSGKHLTSSTSIEHDWKLDEVKSNIESDTEIHQPGHFKKSHSLGSGLYLEGRASGSHDIEDEIDQGLSCDEFQDHNGLVIQDGSQDQGVSPPNQYQEALLTASVQVSSDLVNDESIFSIGEPPHVEKEGPENSDAPLSGECAGESGNHTPHSPPVIVKSRSSPNIGAYTPTSGMYSPFTYLAPRSRSSEDLHVLDTRRKDISISGVETLVIQDQERDDHMCGTLKNDCENPVDDGCDSYKYVGSAKDWVIPVMEEANLGNNIQEESSLHRWDELPSKDFKIKRIKEWVTGLQHSSSPLDEISEIGESSHSNDQIKRGSTALDGLTAAKLDTKVTPGMEAAKRYISSLSATATTAQLANNGLVVIPFLSAFVSLKVLNISGNAIVRITAGALPRGLHILNLSKNNISTIEGLRELTRLRVLDLSYNRIFRIGHGLASCSSLKELYLAGNKISEVEGLHRLLKLNVLDLRFNKISTAKSLGQLAANYNSLQAISLEGNPAQKNVGDEQLKKYLHGLLPHLAYFNRQPIKVSTLKDATERSVRLGSNTHQFDRSLRSEHKTSRKGSHGVATHKPSSSSTFGRKSQAVVPLKQSRSRHGPLPPSGTKATTNHRHHYFDFGNKLLNLRQDLAMRRSRSEGTLGAL